MRFGLSRKGKEEKPARQVSAKKEMNADLENELIRDAILRAAAAKATRPEPVIEAPAAPTSTRQLGILLLPETQDLMEFWTLYQSVQKSGIPAHVGIFSNVTGTWTEEQSAASE
ncbi:MAG: hypothetical protein ACRD38_12165 [Nitrososphaerales archaeon]